jgi:hypothetical protein
VFGRGRHRFHAFFPALQEAGLDAPLARRRLKIELHRNSPAFGEGVSQVIAQIARREGNEVNRYPRRQQQSYLYHSDEAFL